jgi:hypothetical protein
MTCLSSPSPMVGRAGVGVVRGGGGPGVIRCAGRYDRGAQYADLPLSTITANDIIKLIRLCKGIQAAVLLLARGISSS